MLCKQSKKSYEFMSIHLCSEENSKKNSLAEQSRFGIPFSINGKVHVIVSDVTLEELEGAPEHVRELLGQLPESIVERITSTAESNFLAAQYVAEKVVGKASLTDCRHIALATINHADCLVSLNFKHIANLNRIYGYNGVNLKFGYPIINILTPDMVTYGEP